MGKKKYITSMGELSRKDNSLCFRKNNKNIYLPIENINEMKELWNEKDERVLRNYLLCYIFNKEFYHTKQFAMMKMVMLTGMLKFRILLNKKYLKRELTDEELIYTIKSHDNDFSHDGEFFNQFYNYGKENIDIEDYIRKMITILY